VVSRQAKRILTRWKCSARCLSVVGVFVSIILPSSVIGYGLIITNRVYRVNTNRVYFVFGFVIFCFR
jgi:hypothetical protein